MKERLDILLVKKGLSPSREQARLLIMAGEVFVAGQREDKAGARFEEDATVTLKSNPLKYVSRGGLKLEKAIQSFGLELSGCTCMDVGASTGGFTDCMLQNGAKKVYAVDVGRGQLAWKLRQDGRVVCMEKTNVRYMQPEDVPEQMDFISVDVSFISLSKILPAVKGMLKPEGTMVCLIKPQFEAGREKVGKKGVVRDKKTHREVWEAVCIFAGELGFALWGGDFSPIKGPEGNIEYLLCLGLEETGKPWAGIPAESLVEAAHAALQPPKRTE